MSDYYSEEESAFSYDVSYDGSSFSYDSPLPSMDDLFPEENQERQSSPPPVTANDDNNIVLSISINQSREFLEKNFNIPVKDLKKNHVPGLVILRLEDFSTIRNVSSLGRIIPHFLIGPPPDSQWLQKHPDFNSCFNTLVYQSYEKNN